MSIKKELTKLNEIDIWSIMLFALYKVKDVPEYAGLSELAYILDKKNLLKLCEYFGGCTITVPRIDELEMLLYGLLLYQYVDVERMELEDALELIQTDTIDKKDIRQSYIKIKDVLNNYELTSRGRI